MKKILKKFFIGCVATIGYIAITADALGGLVLVITSLPIGDTPLNLQHLLYGLGLWILLGGVLNASGVLDD